VQLNPGSTVHVRVHPS